MEINDKLIKWQKRLSVNQDAWDKYADLFDHREELVRGSKSIKPCCDGDTKKNAYHVRNIVSELIESQVDTAIPQPKVTARNKEDEHLAKIIEDMLIDELDRLPMEVINDMMERTVPIQGGSFLLIEWDNTERTQNTIGDITVQYIHPKQIVPQNGVFSSIEDMDYIIIKMPQTKEYIKKRYGVDVSSEDEQEPEIRSMDGESAATGMVTQYVGYFRNDSGGIGKFSWVNDIVLEDLEDYQSRQMRRCKKCGAAEPADSVPLNLPAEMGKHPLEERDSEPEWMDGISGSEGQKEAPDMVKSGVCPYCGSKSFEVSEEGYEEVYLPMKAGGLQIPGQTMTMTESGPLMVPTKIPYYKPDIYPVIMQRSVSIFGQLLGDSDVDKIESQQNSINRLAAKILDNMLKGGSFATLPPEARIRVDNEDMKIIRLNNPSEKAMIDVYDMQIRGDSLSGMYNMYQQFYEEARENIGITDSYQGRKDPTATSGKAKEFAAQQSAGRLESKRVMKEAAYQQLYEAIFKFKLAYADEPRSVITHTPEGNTEYEVFNRYDFLRQDDAGEYYWNDEFIFSVDSSTPLAKDREAMWQETRMNLQTGAFGDPASYDTLILFWSKMENLHYPGAADTKKYLEQVKAQQQVQQQMMMQQQQQIQAQAAESAAVENILKEGVKKDGRTQAKEKGTDINSGAQKMNEQV